MSTVLDLERIDDIRRSAIQSLAYSSVSIPSLHISMSALSTTLSLTTTLLARALVARNEYKRIVTAILRAFEKHVEQTKREFEEIKKSAAITQTELTKLIESVSEKLYRLVEHVNILPKREREVVISCITRRMPDIFRVEYEIKRKLFLKRMEPKVSVDLSKVEEHIRRSLEAVRRVQLARPSTTSIAVAA